MGSKTTASELSCKAHKCTPIQLSETNNFVEKIQKRLPKVRLRKTFKSQTH